MSSFRVFIAQLSAEELAEYAARCESSPRYVDQLKFSQKVPRRELMARLVLHSGGRVSRECLLEHFYPPALFASDKAA
ncbi:hypothetical protein QCD60_24150 [Pokkaliibacter sp. MBI-7]|uniref:hypothetical protein n=1 Tax=Pokkaliibacter sp. MBI-7 TaxID=3040600 RepID=UPI0024483279|nr:hypothetical protein [Pokkaliibacter sp. MBI-7]MDH2435622.1 hypothetical protein [Pokkaliibacter sp. MBI-7]